MELEDNYLCPPKSFGGFYIAAIIYLCYYLRMINKKLFQKLRTAHQHYGSARGVIIRQSNAALHKSKQAIFSLHRDQILEAEKRLTEAEEIFAKLKPFFLKGPNLKYEGAYKAALEEYLEAKLFWQILKFGRLKGVTKIKVGFDSYLAALGDLTGEMNRKIILFATEGKIKRAEELKEIIADIVSELIKLDLTGYLRHKFDDAKRNLKKAEEIIYDLKVRKTK